MKGLIVQIIKSWDLILVIKPRVQLYLYNDINFGLVKSL